MASVHSYCLKLAMLICIALTASTHARRRRPESQGDVLARSRNGRLFSIFSVVTFKNVQCTGSSSTSSNQVMGTCLSSSDCSSKDNAMADGHCASGFGVCCVVTVSGCTNTVAENCTYVQNEGYPSAITSVSTTCKTTITRSDNLCQIRLDFESFSTLLDTTTANAEGTCSDTFQVSAPFSSSTAAFPPTVCGTLTGQHMYFETGSTGDPSFQVVTSAVTGSRTWRIKVTHIECTNCMRAPAGCDQYVTGASGIVETYNFDGSQLLQAQDSQFCVRQEAGFCSLQWSENPSAPDSFDIYTPTTATETATCPASSVSVSNAGVQLLCGGVLGNTDGETLAGTVVSSAPPFRIGIKTGSGAGMNLPGNAGFSLAYTQLPC